jgi:hypothetical protein
MLEFSELQKGEKTMEQERKGELGNGTILDIH